jgi:hypothetical protein
LHLIAGGNIVEQVGVEERSLSGPPLPPYT